LSAAVKVVAEGGNDTVRLMGLWSPLEETTEELMREADYSEA
jgi:hypothetical protein